VLNLCAEMLDSVVGPNAITVKRMRGLETQGSQVVEKYMREIYDEW